MDGIKLVEYSKNVTIYNLFKCEIIKETTDKDAENIHRTPTHGKHLPQLRGGGVKQRWAFSKLVA